MVVWVVTFYVQRVVTFYAQKAVTCWAHRVVSSIVVASPPRVVDG
jgi:hypothetical protein